MKYYFRLFANIYNHNRSNCFNGDWPNTKCSVSKLRLVNDTVFAFELFNRNFVKFQLCVLLVYDMCLTHDSTMVNNQCSVNSNLRTPTASCWLFFWIFAALKRKTSPGISDDQELDNRVLATPASVSKNPHFHLISIIRSVRYVGCAAQQLPYLKAKCFELNFSIV